MLLFKGGFGRSSRLCGYNLRVVSNQRNAVLKVVSLVIYLMAGIKEKYTTLINQKSSGGKKNTFVVLKFCLVFSMYQLFVFTDPQVIQYG